MERSAQGTKDHMSTGESTFFESTEQATPDFEVTRTRVLVLNMHGTRASVAYSRALAGTSCDVAFITTEDLDEQVTSSARFVRKVSAITSSDPEVQSAIKDAEVALGGPFDRIVTIKEELLETAAELRVQLGVPGDTPEETKRFRDKAEMKRVVREAGVRAPEYVEAHNIAALTALAKKWNYQLVFKPKDGSQSRGLKIVESQVAFEAFLAEIQDRLEEYEVEEMVHGTICHVDGVVVNGRIQYVIPSRYIGTPYGFSHRGETVGGTTLDESDPNFHKLRIFAEQSVRALKLDNSAFHLEVIEEENGRLCFLEMGARAGGGPIAPNLNEVLGRDILADDFRLKMGENPLPMNERPVQKEACAGYLLFPSPNDGREYRVVFARSVKDSIPGIFDEVIPKPGDIISGDTNRLTMYVSNPGIFRVHGPTQAAVEATIQRIKEEYKYELEPIVVEDK